MLYDNQDLAEDIWKDLSNIAPAEIGNSYAIDRNVDDTLHSNYTVIVRKINHTILIATILDIR